MNQKLAEIQYLAGVINESQYHELFGFNIFSSKKDKDKDKVLGLFDIEIDNNSMHIHPVKNKEGLSPKDYYLALDTHIDTHLALTDDQLKDFVNAFGDDLAKDKLQNHQDLGIRFQHKLRDVKLKLTGNELHMDDGHDYCYEFSCHLRLLPDQVTQLKK